MSTALHPSRLFSRLTAYPARLWRTYNAALRAKPLRTRMISSGVLYIIGDHVAQVGIEDKRWWGSWRSAVVATDSSRGEKGSGKEKEGGFALAGEAEEEGMFDWGRLARMSIYGTFIFAPMGHVWLTRLERINMSTKIRTIAARVSLDALVWSPWVGLMFPICQGAMELKSPSQIYTKVTTVWWPTYSKAICVFAPTQIINFSIVPPHLRMLVLQNVGLGWNIFLSWSNNRTNKLLHQAWAQQAVGVAGADEKVERLEKKRDRLRGEGAAERVGSKLGWA